MTIPRAKASPATDRIGDKHGASVRIALVDPASPFVDVRFPELHETKDSYVAGIESNIERLKNILRENTGPGTLKIKLYNAAPGICLYATEDVALVGMFLAKTDAVNAPCYELSAKTELYRIYIEHFERVWQNAKPVT
ncbi:hypothetical protein GPL17_35975 [Bradyrhizobium yuanmingense]|uniref:DUF5919 domain-containing protein n=1 Tax=Bradyrhizobium yuanmingense TaxID=108015 RepID=UPI0012FAED4F|nr:DUF5919 domain-containing protein [Bradyrhizobium yuanmingense]MDF0522188.1 DUF5919 domain-containing protein [Bradyrhizobium yuanmingense]MVT55798.1 hypothetical protein [Bradyrhizobium yuanmingense]